MDYQDMSADEYIEKRLNSQQKYHSEKSLEMKNSFFRLSLIVLILTAVIPVITYFIDVIPLTAKVLIAAASGASSVITGYLALTKKQELFIEYRITSEQLKNIDFLYKTKTPPFDDEDAFKKLVIACEDIISKNNNKWHSALIKQNETSCANQSTGS